MARPAAVPLAWNTTSQSGGAAAGAAKPAPSACAISARDATTSTTVTRVPGSRAQSRATSSPTTPPPTTAMWSAGAGAAVPQRIERGLHIGGQHRARRRHPIRDRHDAIGRHREDALVRMQREHDPAAQLREAPPRPAPPWRSRIWPETETCRPFAGHRMRRYWLAGTRPSNTSRSVPRLIAPNSARTRTCAGPGAATLSGRSSARPAPTYQRAWIDRSLTRNPAMDLVRRAPLYR